MKARRIIGDLVSKQKLNWWLITFICLAVIKPSACNAVVLISTNTQINVGVATFDGSDLVVSNCTVTINGSHSFNSLLLTNNAIVTDSSGGNQVLLTIAGDCYLDASSRLDVSGKGYGPAGGPGAGTSAVFCQDGGGAGYGGNGGNSLGGRAGGICYGSLTFPTDLGSGGGNNNSGLGGAGGGAIRLNISGNLTLNGSILANGNVGASVCGGGGGGSGGSIYLTAATLAGSGVISASGGNAGALNNSGGGGGGRIAVYFGNSAFNGLIVAFGGAGYLKGGAGTVLLKSASNPLGQLFVDAGTTNTVSPTTLTTSNAIPNIQVQGGAQVFLTSVSILGDLVISGSNTLVELISSNNVAQNVVLTNSCTVTHPALSSNTVLAVAGDVTIDSGSIMDVTGKGYGSISGPGAGAPAVFCQDGGGGGYGGNGGNTFGGRAGGTGYGSVAAPTDLGSGGGSNNSGPGGSGGGAIHLAVAGTLTVNGNILANGTAGTSICSGGGGGSGGSIYLETGMFSGSGLISANGGNAGVLTSSGGGGGGRVAVYFVNSTYSGVIVAVGGAGFAKGGAGTIFVKPSTDPLGNLLMDAATTNTVSPTFLTSSNYVPNLEVRGGAQASLILATLRGDVLATGTNSVITVIGSNTVLGSLNLLNGATLTHPFGSNSAALTVARDMNIDSASQVDVSGRGYGPATGPGAGTSNPFCQGGGGAGYGGIGGNSFSGWHGGSNYGSLTFPSDLGSGGGNNNSSPGGAGGGAIQLNVAGNLTVSGNLFANGNPGGPACGGGGGGSGGSLYLTAGTLAGSGVISANGGNAGTLSASGGGGGAGGRIVINTSINSFAGQILYTGGGSGFQNGGPGTLYTKPIDHPLVLSQQAYGRIDSPNLVDRWVFSAVAGQQVQLQQIGMSPSGLVFDLNGPGGLSLFAALTNQSSLITLTNSGTYDVTVRSSNLGYHGAYTFILQQTPATNLTLNTPFTGTFVGNGQAQIIAIIVTNSGPLLITLSTPGINDVAELYVQRGVPPTRGTFDYQSTTPNSGTQL